MDINALNLTAALRMSRAQSGELLPFPAVTAHDLPRFLPPAPFFKPGATALDWTLYESLVKASGVGMAPQKPATESQNAASTSAVIADQPLDLSVGPKMLNNSSFNPTAGQSYSSKPSGLPAQNSTASVALDLTKGRNSSRPAISPKSPPSVSSKGSVGYDGRIPSGPESMLSLAALPKIYLNCKRCSFVCNDTLDFQKHFTQAHNSMPTMNDIMVTNSTTRPSPTVSLSTVWQQKMPTPKESVCFHCSHCGWQCDISNADVFTKHVSEHVNDSGSNYRCYYCKTDYHDPNHLREHIAAHAGINHYICSFCCIAFSTESMATTHMEQKHEMAMPQFGQAKWPVANFKMSTHNAFSSAGGLLNMNIKREASEVMTARVPPSIRSDLSPTTKMATVSPMSRPDPSPESPKSSDSSSGPFKPLVMKRTGFGQSLAKHIEAAISRELMGNKSPTMSDLMFMKSTGGEEDAQEGIRKPATAQSSRSSNPLSLMSLLDKVVEESLRNVPVGQKAEKTDLKFMVSFSDDEDGEKKVKDKKSSKGVEVAGEQAPHSTAKDEAVVSSSQVTESSKNVKEGGAEVQHSTKSLSPQPEKSIDSSAIKESPVFLEREGHSRQEVSNNCEPQNASATTVPIKRSLDTSSQSDQDYKSDADDELELKRFKVEAPESPVQ